MSFLVSKIPGGTQFWNQSTTMKISTFNYRGKDIDLTYGNKNLAYTFEHEGKSYGFKVELKKRDVMTVASATFLLVQNAIETMDALGIKYEN